jgi:hypothetical protein
MLKSRISKSIATSIAILGATASVASADAQIWAPDCMIDHQIARVQYPGDEYPSGVQVSHLICAEDGNWVDRGIFSSDYDAVSFAAELRARFFASH